MIAFAVPDRKFGVGSGYAFSRARPFALSCPGGMKLFGKGWPVCGLMIVRAPLKKPLFGSSSSPKSPVRIFAVGTVAVFVCTASYSIHSWATKKKSLSFMIGPPIEYAGCLYLNGAAPLFSNEFGLLLR